MEKTPAPLSRKAPGDRRLSFDKTGRVAFFIRRICSERKGVDFPSFFLPPSALLHDRHDEIGARANPGRPA